MTSLSTHRFFSLLIGLLLLSIAPTHAKERHDKIVLQLHWQHQFEYAGYYAAQHQGYFAEEGLEVQIQELTDQGTSIDKVLSGAAQYGISPSALIFDRMQGYPLVLLANDLKSSPLSLLASNEYTELTQLKGHKVMAAANESLHAEIVYMLKANGIEFDELNWIPHSFKTEDVINGHAAAMTAYRTNQPYELIRQNIPYTIFYPRDYGIDFYGNCLFTSQKEIKNHPQRARKILNASRRGWEYALAHPEEIIDYIIATYPIQKSREALRFEATEIRKLVFDTDCPAGSIDPQKVYNIARMFVALGMADTGYDLTGFISPEAELCRGQGKSSQPIISATKALQISVEEQDYLAAHPPLTTCMLKDWPPYEMFDEQGNAYGLGVDLSQLLEQSIGKKITPVPKDDLSGLLNSARERQCDMILLLDKDPSREQYLTFTVPIFKTPFVIIGRSDLGYYGGLDALSGKTLVLSKGHKEAETIRRNHPAVKLIFTESLREAFQMVQKGEADATLCALASFFSSVSMMGLTDLEIIGETALAQEFAIGVRNDEPALAAIMQKAVAAMNPKEVTEAINRWFNVRVEKQFDYVLFWKIFAAILTAVALLLYRHLLLTRYHSQLQTAHEGMRQEKERAEKALQSERKAVQSNLRFIDMISHEYRTPVSVISTNLDILKIKSTKGVLGIDTNLAKMKQATTKLTEIIETSLDQSRLSDDKLIPRKHVFNLDKIITETVFEVQSHHPDRLLRATKELPENSKVNGDAALIKIMLRNLLENALKYSPTDETVTFSSEVSDQNFTLTIQDGGRGIPEQEREQIFDKFHRATNTTDVPGAGIGLHIVKSIIDQHGGHISASFPESGGTIMSVVLPSNL